MMTFNPNLFDELFGAEPPVARPAKRRIRAYSPEYYAWIKPVAQDPVEDDIFAPMPDIEAKAVFTPVVKAPTVIRAADDCDHPECQGGRVLIWTRGKYIPCARCRGTGKKSKEADVAHQKYLARKASGLPMKLTFESFL